MTITAERPAPAPPRHRAARWVPAGSLVALVAGLGFEALATDDGRIENPFLPVIVASAVIYGVLGLLVARRHPAHPVARVLSAAGLVAALTVLAGGHANAALFGPLPDFGAAWSLWFSRWTWVPLLGLQAVALPLAYPDGRLPSPRWRPAAWFAGTGPALLALVSMTAPFSWSVWEPVPVENPLAVDRSLTALPETVAAVWTIAGAAVAAAALLVRARRGDRRIGPVLVPALLMPPALVVSLLGPSGLPEMVVGASLVGLVTWSMLRHHVLDLDVLVNRTLVYGLLAASLVGAYVAIVTLTAQAVGSTTSWLPGAVAAAAVAVVLGPLLHQLRTGVDRFLHGHRAEPGEVVVRLAGSGADGGVEEILDRAAAALQATLRVPWVRLEVGGRIAAVGEPRTAGRRTPLRHGDEDVGALEIGARYDGERTTTADERVLAAVTAQLAGTAHALVLAQRLATARERLVAAREDERRRLRRDLHDGLGPALAGIGAGLEGAEAIGRTDAAAAVSLLPGLREQTSEAVADVRRLVDGLRPPALDSLGLLGAVRQELARLAGAGRLAVRLSAPDQLPDLGAATEVAALRIAVEAVHNVQRHARARSCRVDLAVADEDLVLTVSDDGAGIAADAVPHVGLHSMRERAEEVGGTLVVESVAGTTVRARLPLGTPR